MSATKTYLGDGVYVERDEWDSIKLTTENGITITNTIYLDPEVLKALMSWVKGDER